MKKIILYTIVILLITQVNAVQITEIMYNPEGNDNNKEFIEIEGTNNLTDYMVGDLEQNDTLTLLYYHENSNYSLIVEDGFNYTNINASIYSVGATIGNNLDNTQDTIFLFKNNETIEVNYTNEFANDNGYSLELIENKWLESNNKGGSPGIKNLPHTNFCNVGLNLYTDKEIYQENETVKFQNIISDESHQFIVSYYITDLFNNLIKEPKNTSSSNEKSFTPYIFETEQVFMIHNELIFLDCNNTNNNLKSNKTIIIKGNKIKESKIEITPIEKTLEFGDTVWVNLEIYKGNSSNDVLYIYLQKDENKITKKIKLDLKTNYQEYKLSIPINIPFDCQGKFENGSYDIKIEGFDLIEKTNINLEGRKDICSNKIKKEIKVKEQTKEEKPIKEEKIEGDITIELIKSPEEIEVNEEFQIELKIDNQKFTTQKITLYSYVYSGPVSISGEREENKQELEIESNTQKEIILKNKVSIYKNNTNLKVRYTINNKEKEITKEIFLIQKQKEAEQFSEQEKYKPKQTNSITTNAIYESSGELSKKYGIYMFIAILILIISIIGIKNEFHNKNNNRNSGLPERPRGFYTAKSNRKNTGN